MSEHYDAIIIGSGFGGSMTAHRLISKGLKVLMLERGDWVERGPQNWESESSLELTENYDHSWPYDVRKGGQKPKMGVYACVGGPSVFYGGVSFRFREDDFNPPDSIIGDTKARWPISYNDLEKYYTEAEYILQISGESGTDPTEPHRSSDFPQKPGVLSDISQKIRTSAEALGLHPFNLPLAINYHDQNRGTCQYCTTCDTFACAVEAKNDLATLVIPKLIEDGMELLVSHLVCDLIYKDGKIIGVKTYDKKNKRYKIFNSDIVVLSAGALGSPQLALSSGLDRYHPSPDLIGRYLMRHTNCIIFGIFPGVADKQKRFHKQLAILDFYFGHKDHPELTGKIGSLQQVPTPPGALVENEVPGVLGKMLGKAVTLLTGLLAIAEDQPQYENRLYINKNSRSEHGIAHTIVEHTYADRDKKAIKVLIKEAKKVMRKSGAVTNYVHHIKTFSHAVGTMRMGSDPNTSVLDENCRFRGVDNLFVLDGSFMPTSAALNPSLTISANALRVADYIVDNMSQKNKV